MKWLHWPRRNDAAPRRAFCFPYAGSGTSAYSGWAERLKPQLDVCIVVAPGRESRYSERALGHIQPMVEAVVGSISRHLDRPFVFFGHSLGALIAFEVARALRRGHARLPEILFVSAAPAPQCGWPHRRLHQLNDDEFVSELRQLYDGIPQPILEDPELRTILLPTLRADLSVVETYQYVAEPALSCPISAFSGRNDRAIESARIAQWKDQTSADFRLREIEGDHFYIRSARQTVTDHVLGDLGEWSGRDSDWAEGASKASTGVCDEAALSQG